MTCPYCKYEDTGFLTWKHTCLVTYQDIPQFKKEAICEDNKFLNCPYYNKEKGYY